VNIANGTIVDARVVVKLQSLIEKGPMNQVRGIIVHQTGGATAASALSSFASGAAGAHLLIDRDGTIYQTARLNKTTWLVGKLKPRCVAELKCPKPKTWDPAGTHKVETAKAWPDRYPSNADAIGIELVGKMNVMTKRYESVSGPQNESLAWLVRELQSSLHLQMTEVFRHPEVSYKDPSEAESAVWQKAR
jgi:N-acetyl-anhydromuramyl-L-alanine amidase AmpD